MYETWFGLTEKPFSIAPDPRYIYLSESHEEALAHLLYGVQQGGGFVKLTGEVGTGKTTLIRALLDQLPSHIDLALVFNPKLSPLEFVETICDELKIPYDQQTASLKSLISALNNHLLKTYRDERRTVVIIDEAQGLSVEVLEQIRLLTNLETTREKLLQIILIGQPELREIIQRQDLRQLAQRITDIYHLSPLNEDELRNYLIHRLSIAGSSRLPFNNRAIHALYRASGGIPRLVNEIADKSLLAAFAKEAKVIDAKTVKLAANQILASKTHDRKAKRPSVLWWAAAVVSISFSVAISIALLTEIRVSDVRAWFQAETTMPTDSVSVIKKPPPPIQIIKEAPVIVDTQPVIEPDTTALTLVTTLVQDNPVVDIKPLDTPTASIDTQVRIKVYDVEAASLEIEEWLYAQGAALSRESAFEALLGAWKIEPFEGIEGCDMAIESGLECAQQEGSWARLIEINRPAVLHMSIGAEEASYLTALSIDSEMIAVAFGDEIKGVPLAAVSRYWSGRFELFWQPPPSGYEKPLYPGDVHEDVTWLRKRLSEIIDIEVEPLESPDFFDERLADVVRSFQVIHKLEPDSIVGIQTIIQLNAIAKADNGPRLITRN